MGPPQRQVLEMDLFDELSANIKQNETQKRSNCNIEPCSTTYKQDNKEEEIIVKEKWLQRRQLRILNGSCRLMQSEIQKRTNCDLEPSFAIYGKDNKMIMRGTKEAVEGAEKLIRTVLSKKPTQDYEEIMNTVKEKRKALQAQVKKRQNEKKEEMRRIAFVINGGPVKPVPQDQLPKIPLKFPFRFPRKRREGLKVLRKMFQGTTKEEYLEAISYFRSYFFNVEAGIQILNESEYKRNKQILATLAYIHGRQGKGEEYSSRLRKLMNQLLASRDNIIPLDLYYKIRSYYVMVVDPRKNTVNTLVNLARQFQELLIKPNY